MASLNDIETKLDHVITALQGGISNIQILPISVLEGYYTLDGDVTFSDIRSMLSNKAPLLKWNDNGVIHYFYPIITIKDNNILSWFRIIYRPDESYKLRITILNENTESENKFSVYIRDL